MISPAFMLSFLFTCNGTTLDQSVATPSDSSVDINVCAGAHQCLDVDQVSAQRVREAMVADRSAAATQRPTDELGFCVFSTDHSGHLAGGFAFLERSAQEALDLQAEDLQPVDHQATHLRAADLEAEDFVITDPPRWPRPTERGASSHATRRTFTRAHHSVVMLAAHGRVLFTLLFDPARAVEGTSVPGTSAAEGDPLSYAIGAPIAFFGVELNQDAGSGKSGGGAVGAPVTTAPATTATTSPLQSSANSPTAIVPPSKQLENGGAENAPAAEEITVKLEEAIQRGFEFLRRQQKADGSFGQGRFGEHIGVTSLSAISLMADGNLPGRGDFGDNVRKALDFVLAHATETGLLVSDETHGPMYGHGFATLFLGEIYGMNSDDDRVRDALTRAVQLIVSCQNDEGGWRYNPVPADADVSVTICEVMALRSARNAGIKVPKSTIDDAIRYVRSCQNDDGGFRYMKDVGGSAWPRTAAGIASLFYAGVYEDQSIERGLDYLVQNAFPRGGAFGGGFSQSHYFYGQYYAVQAMYLAGGERWKAWWPAIREELLSRQNADGSWSDQQFGDAYGTAMALIVLQMPKRYLPIFQR